MDYIPLTDLGGEPALGSSRFVRPSQESAAVLRGLFAGEILGQSVAGVRGLFGGEILGLPRDSLRRGEIRSNAYLVSHGGRSPGK
jgi:hypothetical protein